MSSLAEETSSCNESSAVQSYPDDQTRSSSNLLRVTILSDEWGSSKGCLSTFNKELAIQLAKHPNMDITVYLPQFSEMDKSDASDHNVQLIGAEEIPGYDPIDWLFVVPENHAINTIKGHGVRFGRQISIIKKQHACGWIQTIHTTPEELSKCKAYANTISEGDCDVIMMTASPHIDQPLLWESAKIILVWQRPNHSDIMASLMSSLLVMIFIFIFMDDFQIISSFLVQRQSHIRACLLVFWFFFSPLPCVAAPSNSFLVSLLHL